MQCSSPGERRPVAQGLAAFEPGCTPAPSLVHKLTYGHREPRFTHRRALPCHSADSGNTAAVPGGGRRWRGPPVDSNALKACGSGSVSASSGSASVLLSSTISPPPPPAPPAASEDSSSDPSACKIDGGCQLPGPQASGKTRRGPGGLPGLLSTRRHRISMLTLTSAPQTSEVPPAAV